MLALAAALLVVALGGAEPRRAEAAFPGENGRIAFASNRMTQFNREGDDEIFSINADGTGLRQLTHDNVDQTTPVWSPDGTKIAFSVITPEDADIRVMNADGTDQRVLVDSSGRDGATAWSPDGKKIAFVRYAAPYLNIYVMNADGTDQTRLTYSRLGDNSPSWSPDGTKIAFDTGRDGEPEIYVMDADGSDQRNVSNDPEGGDFSPDWSPDGSRILFVRWRRTRGSECQRSAIFTMDADGGRERRLTPYAPAITAPAWSPDGQRIAFLRSGGGCWDDVRHRLHAMDADGSDARRVDTGTDAEPDALAWQPAPP